MTSQKLYEVYKEPPNINQTAIMETPSSLFVLQEATIENHNADDENGNRETISSVERCNPQLPKEAVSVEFTNSRNCSTTSCNLESSKLRQYLKTVAEKLHKAVETTPVPHSHECLPDLGEQPNIMNEICQHEMISQQDIKANIDVMSQNDVSNPPSMRASSVVKKALLEEHMNHGKTTIPFQTVPEPKGDDNHKNFFLESLRLVADSSTILDKNLDLAEVSLEATTKTSIQQARDGVEVANFGAPLIIFNESNVGVPLDDAVIEITSTNLHDQNGNFGSTVGKDSIESRQCTLNTIDLSDRINISSNSEELPHSLVFASEDGVHKLTEYDDTDHSRNVAREACSENDPHSLVRKVLSEVLDSWDNSNTVPRSQALENSEVLHNSSMFLSLSEDDTPIQNNSGQSGGVAAKECSESSSSLNNSCKQLNKSSDSKKVQHSQSPTSKDYLSPHQDDTNSSDEAAGNEVTESVCLSSVNKLNCNTNTSDNAEALQYSQLHASESKNENVDDLSKSDTLSVSNAQNLEDSQCSQSLMSVDTGYSRIFSEKIVTTENECTDKSSQKLNYSYDVTFFDSIDDEWLPDDVQYQMTPLLEKLLKENNMEIGIGEGCVPENDNMREYDKNMNVSLSPNLRRKSQIREKVDVENGEENGSYLDNAEAHSPAIPITLPSCDEFVNQSEESHDDSVADRTYAPSDDSEDSMSAGNISSNSGHSRRASSSRPNNNSLNDSRLLNISGKAVTGSIDNMSMIVQTSDEKKTDKKYLCKYCKKLYHKLARHLESVHKDEPDVQKFLVLPKGNEERKKIINILRKAGTFEFNTNPKYNSGVLITSRRPNRKYNKKATDYITCIKCLGSYSISNIRHHIAKCDKSRKKSERSVLVLGRAVEGRLHEDASDKLRLEVFPPLKEDDVVRIVRYDRLLIIWGNKLCIRYASHYQHNMVRSRLRYAGRLLLAAKAINPDIDDFASLYMPKRYDDVVKAVRVIANFDAIRGEFKLPAVAMNLGTYLRQIGEILINEYVKAENSEGERNVERFLKVFKVDYATDVNKVALDSQRKQQREREVVLPSIEDIKKFVNYLNKEMKESCRKLSTESFSYAEWLKLAQLTMAFLVTFNRKRVSDIQNIKISRYEARRRIDATTDETIYKSLTPASKAIANKYARMTIRGKKGRTVPLLLFPELEKSIDLILENRKIAGVPESNEFVFGLPSYNNKRIKVVDGCTAMREFSKKSGVNFPETLRGTELRKHIATHCVALNISDNETVHRAEYLGHDEPIHRKTYREHIESRDVLGISRLLEAAQETHNLSDESDVDNPESVLKPTLINEQNNANINADSNDSTIDSGNLPTLAQNDSDNDDENDEIPIPSKHIFKSRCNSLPQETGLVAKKSGTKKKTRTKCTKKKVMAGENSARQ
ncbi:uncharacterized protein [Venturia canescens]|uniref:uncharacterized protein n=1 Tax=Venturia canescens TaxID=32260 RepID=UPI001C9D0BE0|nr:uncharacterized protein LOC122416214 [Venturia canescens]